MNRATQNHLAIAFCLVGADLAPVEIDLVPCGRVLLRQAHTAMYTDHELGEMLRKTTGDHLMQLVVLIATQKSQNGRPARGDAGQAERD